MTKIFTWHVHGSYLYYLSQCKCIFYIPVCGDASKEGYHGRGLTFPFGDNVVEVDVKDIPTLQFDCILFQSAKNYLQDQHEILAAAQKQLPKIYLEHNTPAGPAAITPHIVDDATVTVVHVTHYNQLMWDNNGLPTTVIEHGVNEPKNGYSGHIAKGIVVMNDLPSRGRIAGYDLFTAVRQEIPLDVVGMRSEGIGLGEVLHPDLPAFISQYRFYFHPARHTSLGLSLLEAMMVGMPIVGLATTELPMVIENGVSGYIDTNLSKLISRMKHLLDEPATALAMGKAAKTTAVERFNVTRFAADWERLFLQTITNANKI